MDALVRVVDTLFIPGSISFLLLAMGIGVALLFLGRRAQQWGRRLLVAVLAGYWLMSTPVGADALTALLGYGFHPIDGGAAAQGATAVVVLDGGTQTYVTRDRVLQTSIRPTALRALEAARVYHLLDDPVVIVQGGTRRSAWPRPEGAVLRTQLLELGVPADRIVLDSDSPSTHDHALTVQPLLRVHDVDRFVLVTSPSHIRRATMAFEAEGLRPIPSPAAARSERLAGWRWTNPRPRGDALALSTETTRDSLALLYYWARGWLSRP